MLFSNSARKPEIGFYQNGNVDCAMPLAGMHLNAIQALTSSVNVVGLRYPTEIFHLMEMAQHHMAPHVAMDSR
jgi:hypothetical protein